MKKIEMIKGAAVTIVACAAEICTERFAKSELGIKNKLGLFIVAAAVGAAVRKDAGRFLDELQIKLVGA